MPYLNFSGDCEEAFYLYKRAFGGREPVLARYGDAPRSAYPDMDEAGRNKIMHGHVMLTETGGVSGGDAIWPVEEGSAISIHVYCASVERAEAAFSVLAQGGRTISELETNPPPHDDGVSGMVRDKFGFTWVISAQF